MSLIENTTIKFAMNDVEDDVDFIAVFSEGETDNFVPIQLKEWVPNNIDPRQSLEDIY